MPIEYQIMGVILAFTVFSINLTRGIYDV